MNEKILLVEDDENFGSLLQNYLKLSGYDVDWRKNGTEGYSTFMQDQYDLCILDVMMPHMDGFTLAKKLKEKAAAIPLFFLTAKNQKEDMLQGFKIGADDYLTKPFDTEVLVMKIKALLNRVNQESEIVVQEEYTLGEFLFKPATRMLIHPSIEKKLSPKESLLLELLCQYQGQVMPRDLALNKIWKQNDYFTKRSMDVYIGKLRKYLAADSSINIETFHQMGFQLNLALDQKES